MMTIDDITGYKQDEEKLNYALAELSVIHEHAPIAMMLVDKDRRVCKVNGFASRFANRLPNEMIGLRIRMLPVPSYLQILRQKEFWGFLWIKCLEKPPWTLDGK